MSNFGAGQGLFGTNQNKNQGTSTPSASAFGNLGSNTTSSSAFGGAGTGNTPGGGGGGTASGPTGGLFGGGSAFGSGGNTNTSTSTPSGAGTGNPFGGSLFAGVYASYSIFTEPPHPNVTQQIRILRQLQGLQGQHPGAACSQVQVRTKVLLGRRQDKAYLAIPAAAQIQGAALEVRTNPNITKCNLTVFLLGDFSIHVWFSETCGLWREPLRFGHRRFHWHQWKRWQFFLRCRESQCNWQHDASGHWPIYQLKYSRWGSLREYQTSGQRREARAFSL